MVSTENMMTTELVSPRRDISGIAQSVPALRRWLIKTIDAYARRIGAGGELSALTEFELKDLSYPAETAAEKCRPFWRA